MREADGWDDLRERLRHVVRMRGVDRVADEIPADRVTVFRLLNGSTKVPSLAVRAGIEQVVASREQRESEWRKVRDRVAPATD